VVRPQPQLPAMYNAMPSSTATSSRGRKRPQSDFQPSEELKRNQSHTGEFLPTHIIV
jgi:hypothetical protein